MGTKILFIFLDGFAGKLLGVFLLDVPSVEVGKDIYRRLAQTSKQFLGLELEDFGARVSDGQVVHQFLCRHGHWNQPSLEAVKGYVQLLEQALTETGRHHDRHSNLADIGQADGCQPETDDAGKKGMAKSIPAAPGTVVIELDCTRTVIKTPMNIVSTAF